VTPERLSVETLSTRDGFDKNLVIILAAMMS